MRNLFLNSWFNEDGTPGAYLWALGVLAAIVVFAVIIFLIYRLYGRNTRNKANTTQVNNNNDIPTPTVQIEPIEFEKRQDAQQLEFYDPIKANEEAAEIEREQAEKQRQEEERLQNLMLEEERKRKDLEERERAFEERRQKEEEERLARERQIEEKELQAEKQVASTGAPEAFNLTDSDDAFSNFFADNTDDGAAFNLDDNFANDFNQDITNFWSESEKTQSPVVASVQEQPIVVEAEQQAADPRLEKLMEELEQQKQAEQERFANLMAELEQQKQETARLQGELADKKNSEDLIAQAKKEMEQMIKDSQEKINTIEKTENKEKADKDLLQEIKNVLAVEREAQEQRLREQENSLAAVLTAMENERRIKEENALYAEQEAKKENEFAKMQNQYQEVIMQMQSKFQQMMDQANAQKQVTPSNFADQELHNQYQMQLERERAETVSIIEQMQREVDKMTEEREAERRKYEEKQRALDVTLAEALQTQRAEFEMAQQRVTETNMSNVEKILQDIEKQRAHEQEMFSNILNTLAAEREDNNQAKAALEQMVRESEERIQKLENQTLPRGLDEDTIASLKEVLMAEREEQFKRMEEYKNEIANLRSVIEAEREKKAADEDDGNDAKEVVYTAQSEVDQEMKSRMDAMQTEIQYLNELREAERIESEKRHAELLETLNRTIVTGENAKAQETQDLERESVERILKMERERMDSIINELAESREDTKKAQEAMQQLLQENADLINQLNKKETRGIDEETMSALKDLLAHEREMQEKRLMEAVSAIEEQKQIDTEATEQNAEYEQAIAKMRDQYESELNALRGSIANQTNTSDKEIAENEENDAGGEEVEFTVNQGVNEEVLAQLERLQENISALEEARNAEKEQFEQRYNEMSKSLEDSLKVQRLEMELEKEREFNELKMQQALEAQRQEFEIANEQEIAAKIEAIKAANEQELAAQIEAIKAANEQELAAQREAIETEKEQALSELRKAFEASKEEEVAAQIEAIKAASEQELAAQREAIEIEKEQVLAEQRVASEQNDVSEQASAIIAAFKEEMNRQYEDFVALLNEKKTEAENSQKEFDELVEQASPEEQAILKGEQYDMQEVMEQLREERKAARAEAQALREELEAQRMETEAKLMKQLAEVKEGLVSELTSELEIKEKFDAMEREVEAYNQEKLKQNEEEEARIKQEYEEYKQRIANELVALEEKNAALQAELELARAEQNDTNDELKQAEYEETEKRLREKYMQLRNELMKEVEQVNKQSEEIAAEKQVIEDKKKDLEEEKARLQNEVAMLKQQVLEIKTQDQTGDQEGVITEEQLAEVRASLEAEYQQREKAMLDKLEAEKQSLIAREAQLKLKEATIEKEEERIREQSKAVNTMITNREYSKEEREHMITDYSLRVQDLEERLRQNEKALRENNREFIPLRRIKNTLDRDLRLLRKREAIVAKQEVLVYGVNNISSVDPDRIKKLEQDVKQLSGLQQSVANCEAILNKNKDRYPTLENLDKVLRAQNEQIRRDLEDVKSAMAMFSDEDNNKDGDDD